jgi:hypothetical protein
MSLPACQLPIGSSPGTSLSANSSIMFALVQLDCVDTAPMDACFAGAPVVYTGSAEGTRIRSQRHLKRLTDLGLIRRLWGIYDGPAEYIYMLAGTTGRGPVFHTLDISEFYMRLHERHISNGLDEADNGQIVFDREPWCHIKIGHIEVKPDAFLKFNEQAQYFVEVDRASADRTKLSKKTSPIRQPL